MLKLLGVHTLVDDFSTPASGDDLEVAVCATALPVDVQLEPSPPLQFGATPTMSPTTQHVKVYLPLVHLFSVSQLEKKHCLSLP